jgi:hypothetical protein
MRAQGRLENAALPSYMLTVGMDPFGELFVFPTECWVPPPARIDL